jgi:WD40 repeat protein
MWFSAVGLFSQFYSPHESILCLAYHPLASEYRLACGFASGSMRVMDIASTSMHVDYAQHQGRVLDVLFSPDGAFLYSNGEDGNICAYDVGKNYLPVRMFTTSVAKQQSQDAVAVSGCMLTLSFIALLDAPQLSQSASPSSSERSPEFTAAG